MEIKRNYRTPEWAAFFAVLVAGIATHTFGLGNVLHNCDDIAQQPKGYGTGITSGRWMLSVMGDFVEWCGGNYNLTFVNGILFLLLIGCCASLIVSIFHIKDRKMAALLGMLLISFPSTFSILTFRYTAVYYAVGVLLAVMAVWVFPRKKYGPILSVVLIAFSLGIYQAFIPFTITLFVLLLIQQTVEGKEPFQCIVRRGFCACLVLVLGLLLYYLILQIFLKVYGAQLSDYQGVNEMGKLSLQEIPSLLKKTVYSVVMLPFKDYCGLSCTKLLKVFYLLLACTAGMQLGYFILKKAKNWYFRLLILALCVVFPVAANFVVIMCPDGWFYTLMVYPCVLIGCLPIILQESLFTKDETQKCAKLTKKLVEFVVAGLVVLYSYQANVNYEFLYFANRQVENYVNSLVVQVRMTEGFRTDQKWALVGKIDDPLMRSYWQYEEYYGGIEFSQELLRRDTMGDWIMHYAGYNIPVVDEARITQLRQNETVKDMPCWPNDGSIKIVEDTIVIKFEE